MVEKRLEAVLLQLRYSLRFPLRKVKKNRQSRSKTQGVLTPLR